MKSIFSIVPALLLLAAPLQDARAASKPNVLFIAVDDLNDWIGCLKGHPQALTPNMDRLAARGVLFTNAHCSAPACNPSRAGVFSGQLPTRTGVWSNSSPRIGKKSLDTPLLSQAFQKAGYRTQGTGKLLHGSAKSIFDEYFATEQRWSPFPGKAVRYTDEEFPSKTTDNPRHVIVEGDKRYVIPLNRMPSDRGAGKEDGESFDWGTFDLPDKRWGDTQITDWAIEQLGKDSAKPLFLGVGYYRPHIPLWAPPRFFERFKDNPGKIPPVLFDDLNDVSDLAKRWAREAITAGSHLTVVKNEQWQAAVEAYLACTTYVDHEIGRLLDVFDKSPLAENTVIVLWSDHGWHLGEKEHWGKWTGWERSTKVPLIIVPPKKRAAEFTKAGSRCGRAVSLLDLYPTLAELCGLKPPADLDGASLVPLLRDPEAGKGRLAVTFFDKGNGSLRDDRWRYIRYADGSEELYDLAKDPNEWHNLARHPDHTAVKKRLADALSRSAAGPSQK